MVRLLDPGHRNGRPTSDKVEAAHVSATNQTCSILSPTTGLLTDLDALAAHVDGTFVVVVEVTAGQYRRRCFLTAKSAQRAAERAVERGESVTVYLAELRPLWRLRGGEER